MLVLCLMRALFDYFWTVEQKHPFTAIIKLEGAFNIHCPPKVWKHWQSVVLDDISINPYHFLVQIH